MTNDNGTSKNTSTAMAKLRPEAVTAMGEATGFSTPQIYVVKQNLFKGEGDEADLWLFLTTCKRLGADPFAKQIHAVFRWDSKANKKVMAIQIGIDQLRLTAARTGQFGGRLGPLWKAKGGDQPWVDLWEDDGNPYACKVGGWRIGAPNNPTWAVVKWDEFAQYVKDGALSPQWRNMGAHMLAKVAESQMLRILFPMETRDLRIREETPEAEERTQVFTEQAAERDQAIYQPATAKPKRYATTAGFPAPVIIEGEAMQSDDEPASEPSNVNVETGEITDAPAAEPPSETAPTSAAASKVQLDRIWQIASHDLGWNAEQLKAVIQGEYGVAKSADLTSAQAITLMENLRREAAALKEGE